MHSLLLIMAFGQLFTVSVFISTAAVQQTPEEQHLWFTRIFSMLRMPVNICLVSTSAIDISWCSIISHIR